MYLNVPLRTTKNCWKPLPQKKTPVMQQLSKTGGVEVTGFEQYIYLIMNQSIRIWSYFLLVFRHAFNADCQPESWQFVFTEYLNADDAFRKAPARLPGARYKITGEKPADLRDWRIPVETGRGNKEMLLKKSPTML